MLINKIRKEIAPYGGKIEKNQELEQYIVTFPLTATGPIKSTRDAFIESNFAVSAVRTEGQKLVFEVSLSNRGPDDKIKLTVKYGNFEKRLQGEQVLFAIHGINDEDDHAAAVIGDGDEEAMLSLLSGALMAVERAIGLEKTAAMIGFIMTRRLEGHDSVDIVKELRGNVGLDGEVDEQ